MCLGGGEGKGPSEGECVTERLGRHESRDVLKHARERARSPRAQPGAAARVRARARVARGSFSARSGIGDRDPLRARLGVLGVPPKAEPRVVDTLWDLSHDRRCGDSSGVMDAG